MEFAYLSTTDAEEWQQWKGRNVAVDDNAIGLATEPTISYTNLRVEAIDISVDQDGNVLMLDASGSIRRYDRETERTDDVWTRGDGADIEDARALCVFGNRIYVADGETGDLVILSQRSEEFVGRIDAGLADPIDIIRSNRRIYILDGGTESSRGQILTLRRTGMIEPVIRGLASPVDIAADSSHLYIIERPDDTPVIRIHDVGHIESPSIIPTSRTIDELVVSGTDETVIPLRVGVLNDQELVIIGRTAGTDEMAIYHYTFDRNEWTLTRRDAFALTCSELLTGPRQQHRRYPKYYAIAGERNHVYIIDERQTNRRNPDDGRYSAQAFRRFDSGDIDTEWARITLAFDAFPANTQVVTSYYATNERAANGGIETLDGVSEQDAERLREADIESVWELLEHDSETVATIVGDDSTERVEAWMENAIDDIDGADWTSTDSVNQEDILLEGVVGQYLHVKLELVGSIDSSPQIGAFRAYCPKRTYLRYLPEQFQTSNPNARFLERYLSIFESEFVDIEEEIERITGYFDPEGVPNEYLSWLGSWLAIEYDEEWPAGAKRAFLVQAPSLFKMRGTKAGMARTIRLYLAHVETPNTSWMSSWQKRRIEARRSEGWITDEDVETAFGEIDETTAGYTDEHLLFFFEHLDLDGIESEAARQPYTMHMQGSRSFVVFVGPFVSQSHRTAVERIVAAEKPAHTHGQVVGIKQELKLEGGSFLGINSTLTTREFVLGHSTLGGDAVLKGRGSLLS